MLLVTPWAQAESVRLNGSGTAAPRLNFRIIISHELFLGVGTGANINPRGNNPTIDTVTFDYTTAPNAVGTGSAAPVITGNVVPVRVYGNRGQITLTATHPVNLTSGPNTIPFSQILVTSSSLNVPAPAMNGLPVFPLMNGASGNTNRSATWTYRYLNTVNAVGGVYVGQVTYTASML